MQGKMQKVAGKRSRTNSKEKILLATVELVCEHGYEATSMNMVCEKVGVAKTALYWHFNNKAGLMEAVVEHICQDFIAEIQSAVYQKGTPEERRTLMLKGFRKMVEERRTLFRTLVSAAVEREHPDPAFLEGNKRVTDEAINTIVLGYRDTLGFDLPDMDLFGHTVVALLHAALRRKIMEPDCDLDRIFEDFERVVITLERDRLKRFMKANKKK
jgi:AcrR family transcriptional regulator